MNTVDLTAERKADLILKLLSPEYPDAQRKSDLAELRRLAQNRNALAGEVLEEYRSKLSQQQEATAFTWMTRGHLVQRREKGGVRTLVVKGLLLLVLSLAIFVALVLYWARFGPWGMLGLAVLWLSVWVIRRKWFTKHEASTPPGVEKLK